LKSVYDVAVEMDDSTAALQTVQEPFEVLVRAIQGNLIQEEPDEAPAEVSADASIAQMLSEFKNEIGQEIGLLRAEVAASKSSVILFLKSAVLVFRQNWCYSQQSRNQKPPNCGKLLKGLLEYNYINVFG
jgi:hypothetical protein